MPSKTEEYLALAQRTANGLTRYWESWTDYLTTASRLYKYSFADQLMIYAQRPDATACADFDIWNNRMNRYVRRGAKGIALLDESSGFPRLHYVFDGKRCSGSIPYGYNRLPNDKQTLVVDPVASEVVKRIFLLANEGKSPRTIAELLTEEKVLIPAAYAKKYHPEQYNGTKFSNPYLWGTSSVRTILGRQEYLGHTVLRKSVSTNFKLHKRKETDEDEQYVFQNTHEPIISQELWDSVQKRRCRVNRASAWGTHTNRLSGYLYCADCGRRLTLQTHYSKKDGSTQYSYRCGGFIIGGMLGLLPQPLFVLSSQTILVILVCGVALIIGLLLKFFDKK